MRIVRHLRRSFALSCLAAVSLAACLTWGRALGQDTAPEKQVSGAVVPPFAWNRSDRYEPPNFESFFPDDAEAGQRLDQLLEGRLKDLTVDERLALVRRGLRRTSHYRTNLLGSVGNQFVWNKDPQDRRAIELLYHASAAPDGEIAHFALYHGPTVVSERTPNLVRMLMERYQSLDAQMQERIAWGMKTYGDKEQTRKLLLDLLDQHEQLSAEAIGGAIDTYERVFAAPAPEMNRFAGIGKWVIVYHRSDLSSSHPRAAEILRQPLAHVLRNREHRLLDFVTRVDDGREAAVALVEGVECRTDLSAYLSARLHYKIDRNEMLSPRTLQECRLREFARHLPGGLPEHARPAYMRPPADAVYAYQADEFMAPNYETFFADDAEAAEKLDEVYASSAAGKTTELSDRQLLDVFRRGVRRSAHRPNQMFGWIAGALGWPLDPLLTEIMYQAVDPQAPPEVRKAGIYYGFGLGTAKTQNILEAMFRVYMAPPFDRTTNGNMRRRILWGVRDHEDDKHYLATRFADVLRDHATLSEEALRQADLAYRELTGHDPRNAAAYATRGVYLVICQDRQSQTFEQSQQQIERLLGQSEHVIEIQSHEHEGRPTHALVVRGDSGLKWLVDKLKSEQDLPIVFADLLTRELIDESESDILRGLKKHLPPDR